MKRVLILGCPASGKSTLARELAKLTGLPVIHLDRLHWRSGWVEASPEEFDALLAEELRKDSWIIDGNYGGTISERLGAADTAVHLDLPRWRCMGRAVRRSFLGWGRSRPDMADGCRERPNLEFLRYIWSYRRDHRPRVLAALQSFEGEVIVLKTPAQVSRCVANLRQAAGQS